MKRSDVEAVRSVLRKSIGPTWPIFLVGCLVRSGSVCRGTHWAREGGAEAAAARRLALSVALYRGLGKRLGKESALEAMREILIPASVSDMQDVERAAGAADAEGMERLLALWRYLDGGQSIGQLNRGGFVRQGRDVLRYEVTDCFFARFYGEAGAPELTRLLCESDRVYWPQVAPGFAFHRGGSWENTLAYGQDRCVFVYERGKS